MIDSSTTLSPLSEAEYLLTSPPALSPISDHVQLPDEILHHIARYLDRSSALAFALVARAFTYPADLALQSHIDLEVAPIPYYGRASAPDLAQRQRTTLRMRRRIGKLLETGDKRRWKAVKSLKVTPLDGVGDRLMALLEGISANLESLHVTSASARPTHSIGFDSIDNRIIRLNQDLLACGESISFPSLTHVRFDVGTVHIITLLPLLFRCSPNLTHVQVALIRPELAEQLRYEAFPRPELPRSYKSKIRELSILHSDALGDVPEAIVTYTITYRITVLISKSSR